ncbi:zinc metalloprotease [Rodentibacter pneumotropicus]|uniref:Zinc metalloprotease n=1 Tax=Rodentibacter pneumotropicus TaxID=758 RepID=A0A3S4UC26_9PAST|nr:zinc metalloprotease [Rodentibacter pneumotropicus]
MVTGFFLIAISVLVAVHEYGHFWAARKCGVKVHRFSIGFGKVLWRRTDKQGTEFALSMIPLGGYVKMLDGRAEDVPLSLKSQAFDQNRYYNVHLLSQLDHWLILFLLS